MLKRIRRLFRYRNALHERICTEELLSSKEAFREAAMETLLADVDVDKREGIFESFWTLFGWAVGLSFYCALASAIAAGMMPFKEDDGRKVIDETVFLKFWSSMMDKRKELR